MKTDSPGTLSALIYTSISVLIAGIFLMATLVREYSWVARIGGTVWVFALSMIILMPLVTSQVKKRYTG